MALKRGQFFAAGVTLFWEVDPDEWRTLVTWLPQHPHLFAATVADNVRVGRPSVKRSGAL